MTSPVMAAVAREVVEMYGSPENGWTMDHPVGTGPFMLKEWRRGSKVTLAANPGYRDERFPSAGDSNADASVRANAGKRLPLVQQVEVNIIEEGTPRLLAFNAQQIDYLHVPYELVDRVLENGSLRPEYVRRGVSWKRILETAFTYTYFNMEDPVVGGYTTEKVALRRAIAMAYDVDNEIRVLRRGEAIARDPDHSSGFARARSNAESACKLRPGSGSGAARQVWLQERGPEAIERVRTARHLYSSSVHRRTAKAGSSMSCGNGVWMRSASASNSSSRSGRTS